jgi:NAD(P)-dependent dehydrogenase (short-subunit alcohol dehydrogenase family)
MADVDLSGKVALVTGGSRGLGREMVLAFAEHGADVIIASRKLDNCEKLANEVRERFGRRALPVATNVGDWGQCDALAETAYAEFDTVDILVNNAGMSPLYPSVDQVTEALYDKVFATNLKGPFRLSSTIGTRMAASRGGSILNISSVASIRPNATILPYAAAKAGLNALIPRAWLTRSLRTYASTRSCAARSAPTSPRRGLLSSSMPLAPTRPWAVSVTRTKSSEPHSTSRRTRAATPPVPYFESTEE